MSTCRCGTKEFPHTEVTCERHGSLATKARTDIEQALRTLEDFAQQSINAAGYWVCSLAAIPPDQRPTGHVDACQLCRVRALLGTRYLHDDATLQQRRETTERGHRPTNSMARDYGEQ